MNFTNTYQYPWRSSGPEGLGTAKKYRDQIGHLELKNCPDNSNLKKLKYLISLFLSNSSLSSLESHLLPQSIVNIRITDSSIRSLFLRNLPNLENLSVQNYSQLKMIQVSECPQFEKLELIKVPLNNTILLKNNKQLPDIKIYLEGDPEGNLFLTKKENTTHIDLIRNKPTVWNRVFTDCPVSMCFPDGEYQLNHPETSSPILIPEEPIVHMTLYMTEMAPKTAPHSIERDPMETCSLPETAPCSVSDTSSHTNSLAK